MYIKVENKRDCSGCTACATICPKQCITMYSDRLGFSYPRVDAYKCIDCGLCVKTCPFINVSSALKPRICYAAKNCNDSLRIQSSSGGIFIALANKIISNGGIIFGAVFNENGKVVHREADTIESVLPMMGSKYVQSDISGIYVKVKKYLQQGLEVLFTGTPCQISGLNHYLQNTYENLFTVEVICHGVPSPFVWDKYLKQHTEVRDMHRKLIKINFRDKRNGWRKFGLAIDFKENNVFGGESNSASYYESFSHDSYMQAFLKNLSLRPSCYSCKVKSGVSHADITIGDFWGIEHTDIPDDDLGSSCVVVRSEKGGRLMTSIEGLILSECTYEMILSGNPSLEFSVYKTDASLRFKKAILKNSIDNSINLSQTTSIWSRIYYAVFRRLNIRCKDIDL